jgi:hypothetical protein
MSQPDLNQLRETLFANQQNREAKPSNPKKQVFVDSEAGIHTGDQVAGDSRPISEVQQETFAIGTRLGKDRKTVAKKLPSNTKEIKTSEGVTGWFYRFQCQLGKAYELFLWFDGAFYQVKLVSPELESKWISPHTGHLYSSGKLCLGDKFQNGMPTLEAAYAKSVLWATGMSVALETGIFPFNYNQ